MYVKLFFFIDQVLNKSMDDISENLPAIQG